MPTMKSLIKRLFQSAPEPATEKEEDGLRLALAALLVHAAQIDGVVSSEEQVTLKRLFSSALDLTAEESAVLYKEAEREERRAGDLYGWTRRIKEGLDGEAKEFFIGRLWEVVYADRRLDDYESNLIRRVCGLLHVSDRRAGDLRKEAARRAGVSA